MDYRRPPSNRVKIAPARFRSNEENLEKVKEKNEQKEEKDNSKTINRKRKLKGENLSKEPENESEPKQKLTKISKMTKDKENSIKISAVASVPLGRNGMENLEFVKPGGDTNLDR